MKVIAALLLVYLGSFGGVFSGQTLEGSHAPEWTVSNWINSPPLTLQSLRGKVVLVRWWTAPHCPFCRASAPALNEFHEKYSSQGLVVIGFYHHKSSAPWRHEEVKDHALHLGFDFPVAVDEQWRTLRAWWLDRGGNNWTSVSFLIDRKGMVRFIHPGGQYVEGDAEHRLLQHKILQLLDESP